MKKRFFTLAFLLGMMVFGFGVTGLSAQTLDSSVEWKLPADAIAALNAEISLMDADLQVNPNEPLTYKRKFYYLIVTALEEGNEPSIALDQSYAMFVPATGSSFSPYEVEKIPNSIPLATWQANYTSAKQVMQQ